MRKMLLLLLLRYWPRARDGLQWDSTHRSSEAYRCVPDYSSCNINGHALINSRPRLGPQKEAAAETPPALVACAEGCHSHVTQGTQDSSLRTFAGVASLAGW